MPGDKPKPVAETCADAPTMGKTPIFRRGTDTNALAVLAVSFAGWINQQMSIESVEQAFSRLSEEQQRFVAHSGVVHRSMADLQKRLVDAAQSQKEGVVESAAPPGEVQMHAVFPHWTFAGPEAIDQDATENNILFFVLDKRPCFCEYRFSAKGDGPVESATLLWTVIGPADCTAELAFRMVLSLRDSTSAVLETIWDGIEVDDLPIYEVYTILSPAPSRITVKLGSYSRPYDFGGAVFYAPWYCEPEDGEHIVRTDLHRLYEDVNTYFTEAEEGDLDFWRRVRGLLAKNPEAAFALEALAAANIGIRDVRGTIDRTIAMLETDFKKTFSGLEEWEETED